MSEEKKEVINFGRQELDPSEAENYSKKIEKARSLGGVGSLKGNTPVGHVPRMQGLPILQKEQKQHVAPINETGGVQPRPPGSPVVSAGTQAQLQALAAAQKTQPQAPEAPAAAASEPAKALDESVEMEAAKQSLLDAFDFSAKSEAERILNNKERRKAIEDRCEPMHLEDLIINDEVRQTVHIVPQKFWVEMRSATPEESLFLKSYLSNEKGSDQYVMEKLSLCQLALGIVSINGKELPDHRNPNTGDPSIEFFEKKLKMLTKKSGYIIADLSLNYVWFDIRVRKLFNPDALKNG